MRPDSYIVKNMNPDSTCTFQRFIWTLLVLVVLCVLPVGGAARAWRDAGQWWWVAIYVIASVVLFVMYGYDKSQARSHGWRVSEVRLQGLALVGGWPGALVAQYLFHHKTCKGSFQVVFWAIVALHQVLWWFLSPDLLAYYQHEIFVALSNIWESISQPLEEVTSEISITLSKIWEGISQLLTSYLHEISVFLSQIWQSISQFFSDFVPAVNRN